jgi:hypothetical protein
MYRLCCVCESSQRASIDDHLRYGRDLRSLADEVGLPTRALRHHRDAHVAGLTTGRRLRARPRP